MRREAVLKRFREFSLDHRLWEKGEKILVAVSGGADSTALFRLFNSVKDEFKLGLTVVHLDHSLRGEESERDAAGVKAAAKSFSLPCVVGKADVRALAREKKLTLETAARQARYDFFGDVARRRGVRLVAVGHQADDQAETVLMRLLRGTGPGGLAGMRFRQELGNITLIRPLLAFTRRELLNFLRDEKAVFQTDSLNRDRRFFRNRVRFDLLPLLEKNYNPAVKDILNRLAALERDRDDYLAGEARAALKRLRHDDGKGNRLEIAPWLELHPALRGEVMKLFIVSAGGERPLYHHLKMAERLARGPSGRSLFLPGGLKLSKEFDFLLAGAGKGKGYDYRLPCPGKIAVREANVEVVARLRPRSILPGAVPRRRRTSGKEWSWPPGRPLTELADYSKLRLPLTIRSRRPGDRYRPLGLSGEKELKRLFIELKVPLSQRGSLPVIADREGIVWPVCGRPAHFCRVDKKTTRLLEIRVSSC